MNRTLTMCLICGIAVYLSMLTSGCVFPHFPPPVVLKAKTFPDNQVQMPLGFDDIYCGFNEGQQIIIGRGSSSGEHRFHIIFWMEGYPLFWPAWILMTQKIDMPSECDVCIWVTIDDFEGDQLVYSTGMFKGCIITNNLPQDGAIRIPFRRVHLYSEELHKGVELSGTIFTKPASEEKFQELTSLLDHETKSNQENP